MAEPKKKLNSEDKNTELVDYNNGFVTYKRKIKGSLPFYKRDDYEKITVTPSVPGLIQYYLKGIPVEADTAYTYMSYYPTRTYNPVDFRFGKAFQVGPTVHSSDTSKTYLRSLNGTSTPIITTKFQLGGQLNMDEQQLQQLLVLLVQAAMQGDQQATQLILQIMQAAQLGDQQAAQLAQMIQAIAQQLQGQLVQAAKFGAKLDYIRRLRGQCPEGYEMLLFKQGGSICKKCVKKLKMEQGGDMNAIDSFKCGRKMKKCLEGDPIEMDKCGKKLKKASCGKKMECGAKLNKAACGSKFKKK